MLVITVLIYNWHMTNRDIQSGSPREAPREPNRDVSAVVDAETLFAGGLKIQIEFRGERYQLRRTKAGKLILTK